MPEIDTVTFRSPSLKKRKSFNLLLPEGWQEAGLRYPVLYLLHGMHGDHTDWLLKSRVQDHVAGTPLMVVMPDGDDSFYIDAAGDEGAYESYIVQDLIGYIDRKYPTLRSRQGRCLTGLSMGGYGAIKLALQHPQLFISAASHSGSLVFAKDRGWDLPKTLFGPGDEGEIRREQNDPFLLIARRAMAHHPLRYDGPALYVDCGAEDFLLDANRRFIAWLRELCVPYEYHELPGGHTWQYWDANVSASLAFHLRRLAAPRAARKKSRS